MHCQCVREFGQPLRADERPNLRSQGTEAVLSVAAAGVCHTDLHIRDGGYDLGHGRRLEFAKRQPNSDSTPWVRAEPTSTSGGSAAAPWALLLFALRSLTIRGSYTGSPGEFAEHMQLAHKGVINPIPTTRRIAYIGKETT